MKIKEILIGVTYPYQLAPYMYGRVDLNEVITLEEGDNPENIKKEVLLRLTKQAKEEAHNIVIGVGEKGPTEEPKTEPSLEGRRRRF